MKLIKINYGSAVFFGALAFVMYLPLGLFMWSLRDALLAQGVAITAVQTFIVTPIIWGISGYLIFLVMIVIYNLIAKKFPISWEIKK